MTRGASTAFPPWRAGSPHDASFCAGPTAHPAAPGQGVRLGAVSPPFAPCGAAKAGDPPPRLAPPLAGPRAVTGPHRGSAAEPVTTQRGTS